MIFYFSGTGNSQYAAQKLLTEGEQLINLADCVKQKNYTWEIPAGESVGFVFPVYYGGLPSILQKFINHVSFVGKPNYTYAVITCGADIMGAGKMLSDRLAEKEWTLDAVYPVVMPDNCVILYTLDEEDEEEGVLAAADDTLDTIAKKIKALYVTEVSTGKKGEALTAALYPLYARGRKTKKFWTDESCVSCGMCEQRCPSQAIRLVDGKVTWVKEQCAQCMSCLRCNAIQYGKKTKGKYRYKHPMLRKKVM